MPSPGEALDIQYVRNGDVSIAYHVVGDAPTDLLLVPDFFSNLVYDWEAGHWRPFYERLAQSFRLILFDKRGTGLSDHQDRFFPNLETRMEDVRAVLDVVGSQRAVIFGGARGLDDGLPLCSDLSRTDGGSRPVAGIPRSKVGPSPMSNRNCSACGTDGEPSTTRGEMLEIAPTLAENPAERHWFANRMRVGASPAAGYALNRMWAETDLSDILSAIHVPTIVLARGDLGAGGVQARSSSESATVATFGIPGDDYWGMFLSPGIVEEIRNGSSTRSRARPSRRPSWRPSFSPISWLRLSERPSLATVDGPSYSLVTTPRSDSSSRGFRGGEVDTAGDGFFASFDGPARAIRWARAIAELIHELGLEVRVGVHTGECEIVSGKPTGIAVNTGARVAAAAGAGEVLVDRNRQGPRRPAQASPSRTAASAS